MNSPILDNGHQRRPHIEGQLRRRSPAAWRKVLGDLVSAASRVHHYRDLHTRMVRGAICTRDSQGHRAGSRCDG